MSEIVTDEIKTQYAHKNDNDFQQMRWKSAIRDVNETLETSAGFTKSWVALFSIFPDQYAKQVTVRIYKRLGLPIPERHLEEV